MSTAATRFIEIAAIANAQDHSLCLYQVLSMPFQARVASVLREQNSKDLRVYLKPELQCLF